MTTLLYQLKTELNNIFKTYDKTQHIPSTNNAECITQLKTIIEQSTIAFKLIQDLPVELQKLDTQFWSFLPFVQDPIRELKIGLIKVLSKKEYQRQIVLETESIELHRENKELWQRLDTLEQKIKRPSAKIETAGIDPQIQQEIEAQIRAEVEREVNEEIERLSQQLSQLQKTNQQLQTDNKRLQFKCDAYQRQTHRLVIEKKRLEQQVTFSSSRIRTLEEENRYLKQQIKILKGHAQQSDFEEFETPKQEVPRHSF